MESYKKVESEKLRESERERRRLERIAKARQQTNVWVTNSREKFENEKSKNLRNLITEVTAEVTNDAIRNLEELSRNHISAVGEIGAAHRAAANYPNYQKIKELKDLENKKNAKVRYAEALKKTKQKEIEREEEAQKLLRIRRSVREDEDIKSKSLVDRRPFRPKIVETKPESLDEKLKREGYQQSLAKTLYVPGKQLQSRPHHRVKKKSNKYLGATAKKRKPKSQIRKRLKSPEHPNLRVGALAVAAEAREAMRRTSTHPKRHQHRVNHQSPAGTSKAIAQGSRRRTKRPKSSLPDDVLFIDANIPLPPQKYKPPDGISARVLFDTKTPSAWDIADKINEEIDEAKERELEAKAVLAQKAEIRGNKALKIARLEQQYKHLEAELTKLHEEAERTGTLNSVSPSQVVTNPFVTSTEEDKQESPVPQAISGSLYRDNLEYRSGEMAVQAPPPEFPSKVSTSKERYDELLRRLSTMMGDDVKDSSSIPLQHSTTPTLKSTKKSKEKSPLDSRPPVPSQVSPGSLLSPKNRDQKISITTSPPVSLQAAQIFSGRGPGSKPGKIGGENEVKVTTPPLSTLHTNESTVEYFKSAEKQNVQTVTNVAPSLIKSPTRSTSRSKDKQNKRKPTTFKPSRPPVNISPNLPSPIVNENEEDLERNVISRPQSSPKRLAELNAQNGGNSDHFASRRDRHSSRQSPTFVPIHSKKATKSLYSEAAEKTLHNYIRKLLNMDSTTIEAIRNSPAASSISSSSNIEIHSSAFSKSSSSSTLSSSRTKEGLPGRWNDSPSDYTNNLTDNKKHGTIPTPQGASTPIPFQTRSLIDRNTTEATESPSTSIPESYSLSGSSAPNVKVNIIYDTSTSLTSGGEQSTVTSATTASNLEGDSGAMTTANSTAQRKSLPDENLRQLMADLCLREVDWLSSSPLRSNQNQGMVENEADYLNPHHSPNVSGSLEERLIRLRQTDCHGINPSTSEEERRLRCGNSLSESDQFQLSNSPLAIAAVRDPIPEMIGQVASQWAQISIERPPEWSDLESVPEENQK